MGVWHTQLQYRHGSLSPRRAPRNEIQWSGAWHIRTAAAEVGHHLRREAAARNEATMSRTYRAYIATLLGNYLDIRGQQLTRPDVYASERYDVSQKLGEDVRTSGGAGLLYDSLRRRTGINVVAHRPRNVIDICADGPLRNHGPGNSTHDRRETTT